MKGTITISLEDYDELRNDKEVLKERVLEMKGKFLEMKINNPIVVNNISHFLGKPYSSLEIHTKDEILVELTKKAESLKKSNVILAKKLEDLENDHIRKWYQFIKK